MARIKKFKDVKTALASMKQGELKMVRVAPGRQGLVTLKKGTDKPATLGFFTPPKARAKSVPRKKR